MKMLIELPFFPGFYESDLYNSDTEYWAIKEELEYYKDELGEDVTEDDLDFDYERYKEDVIDGFVCSWDYHAPKEIVESVEFDHMSSPRYYNFDTDRIYATITFKEGWEDKMREFMDKNADWLNKRVAEDWTSYDGFMSFMSNNFGDKRFDDVEDTWNEKSWYFHIFHEQDERYIGIMLGYIMYRENERVREELIMDTLEDIYAGSYVYKVAKSEVE